MKKKLIKLLLLGGAVFFSASCEKVEPTSLQLEDSGRKATVCGYLYYWDTIDKVKPGVTVCANVNLSSFGDEMSGIHTYTATTNEKGFYSITMPVSSSNKLSYSLVSDFTAKTTFGNKRRETVFHASSGEKSCSGGQTVVVNMKASSVGYLDTLVKY